MSEANSAPAASEGQNPVEEANGFDAEFAAFLGHSFDEPEDDPSPQSEETPAGAEPPPQGETPAKEPEGATPEPASAETPAVETPPADAQPDPEIDPADLAAFTGLGQQSPQQQQAPADGAPGKDPSPATQEEDETFAPFQPTFKLKPEMSAALFESEDANVREQALVGLLSSFGNAITQVMEQRIKEYHAPRLASNIQGTMIERQAAAAVDQHFYGKYPELHQFRPAVQRAFKVLADKDPKIQYSEDLAERVAKLAAQGLKASGINVSVKALQKQAAAAPAGSPKASKEKAPGSGFEAGGTRPAMSNSTEMSPDSLVRDLSDF